MQRKSKKRTRRYRMLILLIGLVLSLVTAILYIHLRGGLQAHPKVVRFREDIEQALEPFQSPTVPASSNDTVRKTTTVLSVDTAKKFTGVFKVQEQLEVALRAHELPSNNYLSSLKSAIKYENSRNRIFEFLRENTALMADIHELGLPGLEAWKVNISVPNAKKRLHDPALWNMVTLLHCDAYFQLQNNHIDAAMARFITAFGICDNLGTIPTQHTLTMQFVLSESTISALSQCFPPGTLDDQQMLCFIDIMQQSRARNTMLAAMQYTAKTGVMKFQEMREKGRIYHSIEKWSKNRFRRSYDYLRRDMYKGAFKGYYLQKNELMYIKMMKEMFRIVEMPAYEALPRVYAFDDARRNLPDKYSMAQEYLMNDYLSFIKGRAGFESALDTAMLGLGVELYHRNTGQYPLSLEDAAAHAGIVLPMDPFTNENYSYLITEDAFQLYGVGSNQIDDGCTKDDIQWRNPASPMSHLGARFMRRGMSSH